MTEIFWLTWIFVQKSFTLLPLSSQSVSEAGASSGTSSPRTMSLSLGTKEKPPDVQDNGPILKSKLLPPEPADSTERDREPSAVQESEGRKHRLSNSHTTKSRLHTSETSKRGSVVNNGHHNTHNHADHEGRERTTLSAQEKVERKSKHDLVDRHSISSPDTVGEEISDNGEGGDLPQQTVTSFASNR